MQGEKVLSEIGYVRRLYFVYKSDGNRRAVLGVIRMFEQLNVLGGKEYQDRDEFGELDLSGLRTSLYEKVFFGLFEGLVESNRFKVLVRMGQCLFEGQDMAEFDDGETK